MVVVIRRIGLGLRWVMLRRSRRALARMYGNHGIGHVVSRLKFG